MNLTRISQTLVGLLASISTLDAQETYLMAQTHLQSTTVATVSFQISGRPGGPAILCMAARPVAGPTLPFGRLLLDPASLIVLPAAQIGNSGAVTLTFPVPLQMFPLGSPLIPFQALGGAFSKPMELSNLVEVGFGSQPGVTAQALTHQQGCFNWDQMFPRAGDVFEVEYIPAGGSTKSLKKITVPNPAPGLVKIAGYAPAWNKGDVLIFKHNGREVSSC